MEDRRLAAIVFTDIVGYSKLMAHDESSTLAMVQRQRDVMQPIIAEHGGQWLKEMGDGSLSSFSSASRAVLCAIEIQQQLKQLDHFQVRIGIHLGDVVFTESDVFGDGVNTAARIESTAEAGGISISGQVFDTLSSNKNIQTTFLGEKLLKNLDRPIRIYGVNNNNLPVSKPWAEPNSEPAQQVHSPGKQHFSTPLLAASFTAALVAVVVWLALPKNQQINTSASPGSIGTAANESLSDPTETLSAASADQSEPPQPASASEPVAVENTETAPVPIEQAPDPEAKFITPVLESIPAFDTQAQRPDEPGIPVDPNKSATADVPVE